MTKVRPAVAALFSSSAIGLPHVVPRALARCRQRVLLAAVVTLRPSASTAMTARAALQVDTLSGCADVKLLVTARRSAGSVR